MEKTLVNEKQDSIDLKRTSKGIYRLDIKLYYNESDTDYNSVIDKLKAIDEKLKNSFGGD